MAGKTPAPDREKEKSAADYYRLNTKAIDDLVTASRENAPLVSDEERKRYGAKKHLTVSQWLKALLIKVWMNGIVCYFVLWGLGAYIQNSLDLWLVTAIALGFVTDLITNRLLRLVEKEEGANARYMMFPRPRKFVTLPLNVLYAIFLMALTVTVYALTGLGVEPILFGIVTTLIDLGLVGAKHLFRRILSDARAKAGTPEK